MFRRVFSSVLVVIAFITLNACKKVEGMDDSASFESKTSIDFSVFEPVQLTIDGNADVILDASYAKLFISEIIQNAEAVDETQCAAEYEITICEDMDKEDFKREDYLLSLSSGVLWNSEGYWALPEKSVDLLSQWIIPTEFDLTESTMYNTIETPYWRDDPYMKIIAQYDIKSGDEAYYIAELNENPEIVAKLVPNLESVYALGTQVRIHDFSCFYYKEGDRLLFPSAPLWEKGKEPTSALEQVVG